LQHRQIAVWRDDSDLGEYFAFARRPQMERPELIEEMTPAIVRQIALQIRAHVHGTAWDDEEFTTKKARPPMPPRFREIPRVPVSELRIKPPSKKRDLPQDRWSKGFKELINLFDGSKDPGQEEKKVDKRRR
ncbi:MAG: hypothetical protein KC561_14395, partial [Myxococcales bacterium]|nr:hypothetical protein [Myxococcales bacterium]